MQIINFKPLRRQLTNLNHGLSALLRLIMSGNHKVSVANTSLAVVIQGTPTVSVGNLTSQPFLIRGLETSTVSYPLFKLGSTVGFRARVGG